MADTLDEKVVVVTGATGKQGGAVVKHLLKNAQFRVRAFVRDPEKPAAKALIQQGAEVVQGDLDDRSSIEQALDKAYGVYSVQVYKEKNGIENEIQQGVTLADVANNSGVQHFVYSSVGSAHRHTDIPHFNSKWQIEEHIRSLKLPYTILRPVFLMDNWQMYWDKSIQEHKLSQPLKPEKPLQQVAVDDVGAFAAIAFQNPDKWLGREIDLAGDELTMPQVAQIFSLISGQQVNYEQLSWDQFQSSAGEETTTMYKWFDNVGYDADIATVRQEYPELKTLEQYLRIHH